MLLSRPWSLALSSPIQALSHSGAQPLWRSALARSLPLYYAQWSLELDRSAVPALQMIGARCSCALDRFPSPPISALPRHPRPSSTLALARSGACTFWHWSTLVLSNPSRGVYCAIFYMYPASAVSHGTGAFFGLTPRLFGASALSLAFSGAFWRYRALRRSSARSLRLSAISGTIRLAASALAFILFHFYFYFLLLVHSVARPLWLFPMLCRSAASRRSVVVTRGALRRLSSLALGVFSSSGAGKIWQSLALNAALSQLLATLALGQFWCSIT